VKTKSQPLIAKEGWGAVAVTLAVALAATWLAGWWSLPCWLALVFVLQFFRDPKRAVPQGEGLVVAPADGKVVFAGRAEDPYLRRPALMVSVFMNVFSVHANRAPLAGEVRRIKYFPGKFFNAALDKSSAQNERNMMWIHGDGGADVVCVQIAGLIARRILCHASPHQRLHTGQRYGFIRFGSRVDLYLPEHAQLKIKLGDKVRGGADVVAELRPPPPQ